MKRYIKCLAQLDCHTDTLLDSIDDIRTLSVGDRLCYVEEDFYSGFQQQHYGEVTSVYEDHALATIYDDYGRPVNNMWVDDYVDGDSKFYLLDPLHGSELSDLVQGFDFTYDDAIHEAETHHIRGHANNYYLVTLDGTHYKVIPDDWEHLYYRPGIDAKVIRRWN